jgi:hypothetical protein
MNQDIAQPQRRSRSVSRTIRVLLTVAALTGLGLGLAGCNVCFPSDDGGTQCLPV